jgi:hypothetical protein
MRGIGLVFVSDDATLIGNFNFDNRTFVQNDALAAQAGIEAWIVCAIDEVFFLV